MKRLYLLVFTALLMMVSVGATETPTKPPDGNPPPCCGMYCHGALCCYRPYCGYVRDHQFDQSERMSALWMRNNEQK